MSSTGLAPSSAALPIAFDYDPFVFGSPSTPLLRTVWAPPLSLAATQGIILIFFSCGYLDVSVPRVPLMHLSIQCMMTDLLSAGFPHSDIDGSSLPNSSPSLFAVWHVLLQY